MYDMSDFIDSQAFTELFSLKHDAGIIAVLLKVLLASNTGAEIKLSPDTKITRCNRF